MILTIDIGNSFTHMGLFQKNRLVRSTKFQNKFKDKFSILIKNFISNTEISKIGISSVVTEMDNFYKKSLIKEYHISPIFISNKLKLPINIKIKHNQKVGADRICNAVFAYEYYKRKENVLIIDSGTAITYDIVIKNGDFIGGAIAPGMELLSKSLNQYTSKLPLIKINDLKFPMKPIGKDTKEALSSGILYSIVDSINGMITRIQKYVNDDIKIILAGGNAFLIRKRLDYWVIIKKNCVLEGINIILNQQNDI
jgi:type III pantothenate kinase